MNKRFRSVVNIIMRTINSESSLIKKEKYYYFFLLLSWVILIYPLIDTKLIPGHDYVFHVTRILDVAEAIEVGIFPVDIYVDDVRFWGTPVGIFYPGLFNYVPVLLKIAGVPVEICYNIFIAFIFLLGVFSSWYGFSLLTRSKSVGFFSAVLFVSSGYYLSDAYIRNALGELLGLSFLPLAMACIGYFITKNNISAKIYIMGLLSVSAIVQSHVLSSCFLVLFGLFHLILHCRKFSVQKFYRLLFVILSLLLLNANFIIPFLIFYKSVPVSIDFVETFSQSGWPVSVTFQFLILWSFWLLVALLFFFSGILHSLGFIWNRMVSRCNAGYQSLLIWSKVYVPYFLSGLLFLFMSTDSFPWDNLQALKHFFEIMQFPLRFLGIATLYFCVCGGFGIRMALRNIKLKKRSFGFSACVICMMGLMALYVFAPVSSSSYWKIPEKIYWERMQSSADYDYLYKDIDVKKLIRQGNRYISDADIGNYKKVISDISFSYSTINDAKITLPLVNYPGYVAADQDGRKIELEEDDNHMIVIPLAKGSGAVTVWYQGLFLFKIADCVSLVSTFIFAGLIIWIYRKRQWNGYIQKL